MAEIMNVIDLLGMDLKIPNYQRPYKWTKKNVCDLLNDIDTIIYDSSKYKNYKYRIGTIILHHEKELNNYNIVDGQQRIITLLLIILYLNKELKELYGKLEINFDSINFTNKISQKNIHDNYMAIHDWFLSRDEEYKFNFSLSIIKYLEVVVMSVDNINEAFQLFDSQNTRGKYLEPHDLLKAYHLRAMRGYPYEMEHLVTEWENKSSDDIHELFDMYLFQILNWSKCKKTKTFTADDIDNYKGVKKDSKYTYAERAEKASPCFQITEPFVEGEDFFYMVQHYLNLINDIKHEINNKFKQKITSYKINESNDSIVGLWETLDHTSSGLKYVKNLFYCSLLCYYDRFHNFSAKAIYKLFTWAMMLRVDMENLGFDSINKYAIGEKNDRYSNCLPMFSIISNARLHEEIENTQINVIRKDGAQVQKWDGLYQLLRRLNNL